MHRFSKINFEIHYSTDTSAIVDFTRKNIGDKVKGLKNADYERLKNLLQTIVRNNKGFVVQITDKDHQILAAAFIIKSNNKLIYLLAASTKAGRKLNAMTTLIDDIFKKYIGADSSSILRKYDSRDMEFLQNFGAETIEFGVVKK